MATSGDSGQAYVALDLPAGLSSDSSFFNDTQWSVWYAIMDALIPAISVGTASSTSKTEYKVSQAEFDSYYDNLCSKVKRPPSREDFATYLSQKPSENEQFRNNMTRTLSLLPKDGLAQIGTLLSLLGMSWASYPLTGYMRAFHLLPITDRETVMRGWQRARFAPLRGFIKMLGQLGKRAWIQTSPLFGELTGWKELPENYEPGEAVDFKFRTFEAGVGPVEVETDIVIVGSGCGAGPMAKALAEAGLKVTVVEKGYYFSPNQLPLRGEVGEYQLFEDAGLLGTSDGGMSILAGSTWGGGGTVNWGVSLKTPDYIREEWAKKRNLPAFTGAEFQGSLDRVCEFMGVTDEAVRQNHRGQKLLDGARKMGWKAQPTPHNSANKDHHCGHCHLGCGSSGKQGPAVSWLPAAGRAGAQFIEGLTVERVTFADFAAGKKATGIVGKWVSRDSEGGVNGPLEQRVTRDVVIKAKRVVLSAGTLWSPVLLRKSGLSNPHIGRNLYMHPVNGTLGFWDEETDPWDGCAITSVCTSLENLDGEGHGVKLEGLCMIPFIVYANFTWNGGLDFKMSSLRYRHSGAFFSMPRDRDTGHVYPDPMTGKPKIDYVPSSFDRAHVLEGSVALARILYATDAAEIRVFSAHVEPFVRHATGLRGNDEDMRFEKWLKMIRAEGNPATAPWGCAHQMGSCRMSAKAEDGVVDPKGKVWGFEGLYVADASVFPTATGVNPMVTNMAISDYIARGIVAEMAALKK